MTTTAEPEEPVNFAALSEAEQREVAARLIRLRNSAWKPFWCKSKTCTTGDPHPALGEDGLPTYVDQGTPGSAAYFVNTDTGAEYAMLLPDKALPHEQFLGYVMLDPTWSHNHARRDQHLPNWLKPWTLFVMSGRGTGKTTLGVEFVTLCARRGLDGAILGRRGTELTNTHVAALIERAHPDFAPTYWSSKDLIEWPEVTRADGTRHKPITYLFSAEKPENIRSVNLQYVWADEAAFMDTIKTAWMNLVLATRKPLVDNPLHFLITSTPTSTEWVRDMEDNPKVEVRRVSTYANRANLDDTYLETLRTELEGTRMGRQELHGEVLRDVEGAFWNDDMFIHDKCTDELGAARFAGIIENMDDRVIAVDPAGSANKRSDETGIIGVGAIHGEGGGFYVLADATIKGSPTEWARATFTAAKQIKANRIVAEKNFGGDMVKQVLDDFTAKFPEEASDENGEPFRITVVRAAEAKEVRAEGTVGKYEQGRVTHVISRGIYGDLSNLEKEQTTWVPKSRGGRSPSPNRIDALVWAVRAVETSVKHKSSMVTTDTVRQMLRGGAVPRIPFDVPTPEPAPVDTVQSKKPLVPVKVEPRVTTERATVAEPKPKPRLKIQRM